MNGYVISTDKRTTKSSKVTYTKGKSITVLNFKNKSRIMNAEGTQKIIVSAEALLIGSELDEGVQIFIKSKVYQIFMMDMMHSNVRKVLLIFIDNYREQEL